MKASRKLIPALALCLTALHGVSALTDAELRAEMTDRARKEVLSLAADEVAPAELGEWKDIIDSSLFCLFRRTELYRGPLRVLVTKNPAALCRLYPDGTFVITSALLDWIDETIFLDTSESQRRLRDFESERERRLIPFLAGEAARFALGSQTAAYRRSPAAYPVLTREESLEADLFCPVILEQAGHEPSLYRSWLETMAATYREPAAQAVFSSWLAGLPSPDIRLAALDASGDERNFVSGSFSEILAALRSGSGLEEADAALAPLRERFPSSVWISRLEALVRHARWLASVPPETQRVKTLLPFAADEDPSRAAFAALLGDAVPRTAANPATGQKSAIPGDVRLYLAAIEAYKKTLGVYADPGLSSAYSLLLYASGNPDVRALALKTGEEAAAAEDGSSSVLARSNYALLLFQSDTDPARSRYLLESLAGQRTGAARRDPVFLDEGFPEDRRDILLNLALTLRAAGDTENARLREAELAPLLVPGATAAGNAANGLRAPAIALRNLKPGMTTDELVSAWGRPSEIVYTIHSERWKYGNLNAEVIVSAGKDSAQRVLLVRVGMASPISLPGDIRAGDKASLLGESLGAVAYRAGDCEVYLKEGTRVSVFSRAGRIRSFTAGY